MKPSSMKYVNQIDQQLKNEYHEICFNPTKRQTLLRLTQGNAQTKEKVVFQKLPHGSINNSMLTQYIKAIYDTYGIQDPIKRQFRLAKRNQSFATGESPEKSLNVTEVTDSDKLTRTKKNLLNMKESFKRDNQDIVYSSRIEDKNISHRESNSPNRSRIARQIGYRTKEKMYFKTSQRQDSIRQVDKPIIKHEFSVERSNQTRVTIKFNNSDSIPSTPKQQIPVVFRFCPMCEQQILEYNIEFHEAACQQLQLAYQMPYQQIQLIVASKIKRIESEIAVQFVHKEEKQVLNEFRQLKSSVQSQIRHRKTFSFDKVRNEFQIFAGSTYQKLAKLRWFRNLHRRIQKEESLNLNIK